MSLDTFDNLKQEVIDWSHREDVDLKLDTFIELAETAMVQNSIAPLRVRSGETRTTDVTSGRFLALPTGFIEMRRINLELNGVTGDLRYRAPEQMIVHDTTGQPRFFTITSQIEFDREPDAVYTVEMQYFAEFTPLSTASQTNPVLTNSPNIYLFGALAALFSWSNDAEQEIRYQNLFFEAIRGANKNDKRGRYGPAPAMRIEGSTP